MSSAASKNSRPCSAAVTDAKSEACATCKRWAQPANHWRRSSARLPNNCASGAPTPSGAALSARSASATNRSRRVSSPYPDWQTEDPADIARDQATLDALPSA